VVTHEKLSFLAATAHKAMFGALGAMAMAGEGNDIVARNGIDDSSVYIGEEIAKALAASHEVAANNARVSDTDDLEELASRYDDRDLILFTQTRRWSFAYFPADWDNYRVGLNMIVKLYDPKR
jgi:hypothetical protein